MVARLIFSRCKISWPASSGASSSSDSVSHLCKVLNKTPADQLVKTLTPLCDIDGALKFIAWDNARVNGDGYWTRTSDYGIYKDGQGRFHIIPYDANETFSSGGGPGGPGGAPREAWLCWSAWWRAGRRR